MAKGLSGGQKKRLSIAMELVNQPSVLFLDEPTSGLDSRTAGSVVAAVRKVAREHGLTVVTTIHQPPAEVSADTPRRGRALPPPPLRLTAALLSRS